MFYKGVAASILLFVMSPTSLLRADILTTEAAMNLAVAQESWLFLLAGLQENQGYDPGAQFNWRGTYSSTGATFSLPSGTLNGLPLSLNYTGALTGQLGQNLTWNGTWTGTLGTAIISSSETGNWSFDTTQGIYTRFDFEQNGTIDGRNPPGLLKRWLLKAVERLLTGVAGAYIPGWLLPLVKEALELFSNWLVKTIDPPPSTPSTPTVPSSPYPHTRPNPPSPPTVSSQLDLPNNMVQAILNAGPIEQAYPYQFETQATFLDGRITGTTQVVPVPGPHSLLLLCTGILALLAYRRQPRKATLTTTD
jgi:hypothetical protein